MATNYKISSEILISVCCCSNYKCGGKEKVNTIKTVDKMPATINKYKKSKKNGKNNTVQLSILRHIMEFSKIMQNSYCQLRNSL